MEQDSRVSVDMNKNKVQDNSLVSLTPNTYLVKFIK